MTVPSGAPAWSRIAVAEHYGAVSGLHDLGNCGAVNAKTDITAAEYLRMATDCVSAVRSSPIFWASITVNADHSTVVHQCQPMWAPASGPYSGTAPPNGSYPTITWGGAGDTYLITFPALAVTVGGYQYLDCADDFGVHGTCQITSAIISPSVASSPTTSIYNGSSMAFSSVAATVSLVVY